MRRWQRGWLAFLGLSASVNLFLFAGEADSSGRFDAGVRFLTSSLGCADTLLAVPASGGLAEPLRPLPGDTAAVLREKGARNQQLLAAAGAAQHRSRSPLRHLGAVLVNGLAGLAIALGDGRQGDGLRQFVIGMAVAEARIFTYPTGSSELLSHGRAAGRLSAVPAPGAVVLVYRF